MTSSIRSLCVAAALVMACTFSGSIAQAALPEGMWSVFVFGGSYNPGSSNVDDGSVFGVRVAKMMTKHVSAMGTVSRFETESANGLNDVDGTIVEGTAWYNFKVKKRWSPSVGGGVGWVVGDFSGPPQMILDPKLDENSVTAHAGFGSTIQLSDRFFVRISTRWRWFEKRSMHEWDQESTLNFGFRVGE